MPTVNVLYKSLSEKELAYKVAKEISSLFQDFIVGKIAWNPLQIPKFAIHIELEYNIEDKLAWKSIELIQRHMNLMFQEIIVFLCEIRPANHRSIKRLIYAEYALLRYRGMDNAQLDELADKIMERNLHYLGRIVVVHRQEYKWWQFNTCKLSLYTYLSNTDDNKQLTNLHQDLLMLLKSAVSNKNIIKHVIMKSRKIILTASERSL